MGINRRNDLWFSRGDSTAYLVEPFVAVDVDGHAHQHDAPEHEDDVPVLGHVGVVERGYRAEDEEREREVDGERNGPVADEPQPARDPRGDGGVLGRAEEVGPVVDAAGGWEDGADLCEGGADTSVWGPNG